MNWNKRQWALLGLVYIAALFAATHGWIPAGILLGITVVSGGRATQGTAWGIDQNSRVIDMSDTIHLLDPNEAALTAITMKMRKAHCISPKVEWLEDDYIPATSLLASNTTASQTTIVVTTGQGLYFRKGDVLQIVDTGEIVWVSSVSTDTLTVVRGIGTTAGTAAATGSTVLVIGNANEEGATGRTIKSTQKNPQFNYTQIFRWPYGVTRTLNQSELYGGSDLSYQARKAGIEHRVNMERAFLFGNKRQSTSTASSSDASSGNAAIRFCDGLVARITTNVTNLSSASLTTATMETFLQTGLRYGPARKILFASRIVVSALSTMATSKIFTVPTTSSFPLALVEYVSPHGKIYIVTHNLLTGTVTTNKDYSGWAFLIDLDSIYYRYLQGSDTFIRTNIQANDEDARKDEYITEACPMIVQDQNHAILTGCTGGTF